MPASASPAVRVAHLYPDASRRNRTCTALVPPWIWNSIFACGSPTDQSVRIAQARSPNGLLDHPKSYLVAASGSNQRGLGANQRYFRFLERAAPALPISVGSIGAIVKLPRNAPFTFGRSIALLLIRKRDSVLQAHANFTAHSLIPEETCPQRAPPELFPFIGGRDWPS